MRVFTVAAILALAAAPALAQDMAPMQFAQEYIRELSEQESLRAQAEADSKGTNGNPFISMVHFAAATQLALNTDTSLLSGTRLKAGFASVDSLPSMLAAIYQQKVQVLGRMSDIASAMVTAQISGPKPGTDYAQFAVQMPKLRALLESTDKQYMQTSALAFAALIDPRPDKLGHASHLVITRQERANLISELQTDFGSKLRKENERSANAVVNAAGLLDDLLHKDYRCSDDPW